MHETIAVYLRIISCMREILNIKLNDSVSLPEPVFDIQHERLPRAA